MRYIYTISVDGLPGEDPVSIGADLLVELQTMMPEMIRFEGTVPEPDDPANYDGSVWDE